ncbi:TrkH family potassium uptake protein [Ruminococcus sp. YE282]|jgi:trk system potassium uptake protein TrkH|uniref:TrkH family potassium uptake protein n=1 Tax=Ruminococcus sp. YE282 TaxID=3158780 RepID=UPI0008873A7B|nr:TrkH family potassium uptake protein [Ruminococcus bromii]MEE3497535.1 TrkH family potassium uptake protein [Ruminococcus bromii]SCY58312.1 trk system potassium uptake protein TrkH [Ruminococcus bromii]
MDKKIITYILGWVLIVEAIAMQIGTITSLIYKESNWIYFVIVGAASALVGFVLVKIMRRKNMVLYQKAGFAATALSWILLSLVGCLPFWISGEIPTFIDAFFEIVSGFTTTGSTILENVEGLSHGMLIWRSFSVWLGGMGVIVFLLALIPKLGGSQNIYLMRAESPGPIVGKAVPRMRNYAALLYGIYMGLTALEIILLLCGGMGIFDALNTGFASAGTGGFGVRNNNMAAYSHYSQVVIAIFLVLFGTNFSFYIMLLTKKFKQAFKMEELWLYIGIIAVSTLIISVNISSLYPTAYESFHQGFFYVTSIISTAGFGIDDVNRWPELSKAVIIIITFIGAMAGSTGGGFKVSRILILCKEVRKEFALLVHPRNVRTVKLDGKTVDHNIMRTTSVFLVVYLGIFILSFIIVAFEGKDVLTSFTAVAASINNTGPGLNLVGPAGNYSSFNILSKSVMIFDMIAGRLELYPLLLLFSPSAWKRA